MSDEPKCPEGYEWDEFLGKCVKEDEDKNAPLPIPGDDDGKEDPQPDHGKDDEHGHKGKKKPDEDEK